MPDLERNSHHACIRCAEAGRTHHGAGEALARHRHDTAFAAIVLAGGYIEAGDTGRHRVAPGDVLVHRAFESHLDRFCPSGAEVLVLPLAGERSWPVRGRVVDPDLIVRTAERDLTQAEQAFAVQLMPAPVHAEDWPDLLASALLGDPDLPLAEWGEAAGLHPGSLSRGFRQQFGLTPAAFRATARAHRAVRSIAAGSAPLAGIAAETGFADQAHMSRAVKALTGHSPQRLRAFVSPGARGRTAPR